MRKLFLSIISTLILSVIADDKDLDTDFTEKYFLSVNEETGSYFLKVYVGTDMQRKRLLIDTQANGTAIKAGPSSSSIRHMNQKARVEMPPDGYIDGF